MLESFLGGPRLLQDVRLFGGFFHLRVLVGWSEVVVGDGESWSNYSITKSYFRSATLVIMVAY